MSRTARSGPIAFHVAYAPDPLGGCPGRYEVEVKHGRKLVAEMTVGAPAALLKDPESRAAVQEIAETVAHYLLSDGPLPVERDEGRVIVRV